MPFWNMTLLFVAGLMGASGVAIAAAGAHAGGSNLSTAATFLLIHAAAITAVALHGPGFWFLVAASLLALGACLFAGDLGVRAWGAPRLFPMAAPAGGILMIAGWICLALAPLAPTFTRP